MHVRSCFRPSCLTVLCILLISSIYELFNDAALTSEVIEDVSGVKASILGDDHGAIFREIHDCATRLLEEFRY